MILNNRQNLMFLSTMSALMASDSLMYGEQKPHVYKEKRRSKAEKRAKKLAKKNRQRNRSK